MIRRLFFSLAFFLLCSTFAQAQFYDAVASPHRLTLGGSYGSFRISYKDFHDTFDKKSGSSAGAYGTFLIKVPYNLTFKYREFNKTGTFSEGDTELGLDWREKFYNFGVRYFVPGRKGPSSHFGFGFSVIQIEEKGDMTIFRVEENAKDRNASGFYMELGMHYGVTHYIDTFFEIEITSAAIEGKSGFEGTSVGGYYFALGVAISPF